MKYTYLTLIISIFLFYSSIIIGYFAAKKIYNYIYKKSVMINLNSSLINQNNKKKLLHRSIRTTNQKNFLSHNRSKEHIICNKNTHDLDQITAEKIFNMYFTSNTIPHTSPLPQTSKNSTPQNKQIPKKKDKSKKIKTKHQKQKHDTKKTKPIKTTPKDKKPQLPTVTKKHNTPPAKIIENKQKIEKEKEVVKKRAQQKCNLITPSPINQENFITQDTPNNNQIDTLPPATNITDESSIMFDIATNNTPSDLNEKIIYDDLIINNQYDEQIIATKNYVSRILKKIRTFARTITTCKIEFTINNEKNLTSITYQPKKPSLSLQIHIEKILKQELIPIHLLDQKLSLELF
jgi:hypothetical protein